MRKSWITGFALSITILGFTGTALPEKYNEAPELAAVVRADKLPYTKPTIFPLRPTFCRSPSAYNQVAAI